MKFNNILKKIIEFIDNDDNLCISEYIINDYSYKVFYMW